MKNNSSETEERIDIYGAREHNLQNIDLSIPREELVVITGVSGSGKSSLAFDTLYAEGQRRYLETYSSYVRQFVGGLERPDVDKIEGLSPVIAIDQKTTSKNPRSTVGTITEIYDFIRLLYARISEAYSYKTGKKMESLSDDEIIKRIQESYAGKKIFLMAPVVRGRKGHYREDLNRLLKSGFSLARIDGQITELAPGLTLDRYKVHDIEVIVDRLMINDESLARLTKSVSKTLQTGKDNMLVLDNAADETRWFCRNLMDPESGISYDEPAPNAFSFNSPYGYCPRCKGLGYVVNVDAERIFGDKSKGLLRGAIKPLEDKETAKDLIKQIRQIAKVYGISLRAKYEELDEEDQDFLLYGPEAMAEKVASANEARELKELNEAGFIGIVNYLKYKYLTAGSEKARQWAEPYIAEEVCPACKGARLKKESLHFFIDGQNINELSGKDIDDLYDWFENLEERLNKKQNLIAEELLKEIRKRIGFLLEVGLNYLTLNRPSGTLSGGEAQRIRLATQIGSQLVGVLYILDEPSIGLHQRDNFRLINSLKNLRDLGNTVLVVEHDKDMMLESDYLIDVGPGAGAHGGKIIAAGPPALFKTLGSVTSDYLLGKRRIETPAVRRDPGDNWLRLLGANGNNLKNVDLEIPLGLFVCVTGVSGSGKSSLINQTLYPLLHEKAFRFKKNSLPHDKVEGLEHIDKVIEIDQKPIGRTPRSNSATYTGLFTYIRDLFTKLPESLIRGYKPGRFSFNVKGGRCENCKGAGLQTIEMNFLPDVYVDCPVCRGKRYNRETLEIRYKGKSINDVLEMTVDDALSFFEAVPTINRKLQALQDVGLGYITIGQPATTLSGGEAQRMKIATELSKRDTGQTFFILDEPTTGLHFQDIQKLIEVLNRLVSKGNTVLVIEHNMDVIKVADWLVDLGPEGGRSGGEIIAAGTPETVAELEHSHTGRFLKRELQEKTETING